MRLTAKEIIADFDAHLQKSSKQYYSNFYVGITNNIERRLFVEHNVSKENAWWIYRTAIDKAAAQVVEAVLSILERTPPELSADISDRGIYMTGGGCLVHGLDKLLQEKIC